MIWSALVEGRFVRGPFASGIRLEWNGRFIFLSVDLLELPRNPVERELIEVDLV